VGNLSMLEKERSKLNFLRLEWSQLS
jgi:hypothetical protein